MPQAYTPGLAVSDGVTVRKERKLPLPGDVMVAAGDEVSSDTVVARTELPGNAQLINIAGLLGVPPDELEARMRVRVGEEVAENTVLAETKGLLGLFRGQVRAPARGTLESVSTVTGQAILREPPTPLEVHAYIRGRIVEVIPREGVVVETHATFVQGIFGVGGETVGELVFITDEPSEPIRQAAIKPEHGGKVLVGGGRVEYGAIARAREVGAKAIIGGGIDDADLRTLLGYDLGVAITGTEPIGITVAVTEGFGDISMAQRTFELLRTRVGALASVNGATQIRAGVQRPEIVIPLESHHAERQTPASGVLEIGANVRVIREPHFGSVGVVAGLPVEPRRLETEARVRVASVRLSNGETIELPRANIELVETMSRD
ncbi:hypothetical protein FJZ36_02540 [Candidatus Poribacteria bacterium]|nr:hypothetical protein [Candidatus Poribacteria bacterium]